MIKHWTGWLAILLWTVSIVFTCCGLALMYANGGDTSKLKLAQISVFLPAIISLSTVGALLAIHRRENPLGWIFLAAGMSLTVFPPADEYARYITETAPGSLPELPVFFWLAAWIWIPAFFVPATFGILLFPTGRLPSRRWRPFAWTVGILLSVVVLADMLEPGPVLDPPEAFPQFTNPIGIESMGSYLNTIVRYGELALVGLLLGSAASIFARLKTATELERRQIKWFAYAATVPVAAFCLFLTLLALPAIENKTANDVGGLAVALGIAILPGTIGIAILRHNLYDIDRLINRSLVYGSLTALLLLSFVGSVLLFQFLLNPLTDGNDIAVAGSTLVTLSLFQPVRARLQIFVDRRFYRQKYDAQLTLQAFGAATRDVVNLDQLIDELVRNVSVTMQPEHMSIWLRFAPPEDVQV